MSFNIASWISSLQSSGEIIRLLQSLLHKSCLFEKGGLDEMFMDVTCMAVSSGMVHGCDLYGWTFF
jgi:hypothetical protein